MVAYAYPAYPTRTGARRLSRRTWARVRQLRLARLATDSPDLRVRSADDRLGRRLLRAARRTRLPRDPIRQPQHGPLSEIEIGPHARRNRALQSADAFPPDAL